MKDGSGSPNASLAVSSRECARDSERVPGGGPTLWVGTVRPGSEGAADPRSAAEVTGGVGGWAGPPEAVSWTSF